METIKKRANYDFYLILATAAVLFVISAICVYGMFYFKFAQVNEMQLMLKQAYMNSMNKVISPFVICLVLLLGLCIPKRLLPVWLLNGFTLLQVGLIGLCFLVFDIITALKINVIFALCLQSVVLVMALAGSKKIYFEKKGYWLKVGSASIHLGVILFVLDLFFYQNHTVHLYVFWLTTFFTVLGMIACFYSDFISSVIQRIAIGRKG